ncbi:MAG: hypothetical protein JAY67_20835, partial [Candidatus Thiodiazotropha taylori]|nr:hypothetical protein [Candidatus Thiodiazotropha taylori]
RMYAFPSPSSHLVSHVENRGVNYFGVGSGRLELLVRCCSISTTTSSIAKPSTKAGAISATITISSTTETSDQYKPEPESHKREEENYWCDNTFPSAIGCELSEMP